jgi:hypothetical protein
MLVARDALTLIKKLIDDLSAHNGAGDGIAIELLLAPIGLGIGLAARPRRTDRNRDIESGRLSSSGERRNGFARLRNLESLFFECRA